MTADDELVGRVVDVARTSVADDPLDPSRVASLPPPLRAVYATTLFDRDIADGGFARFFWHGKETLAEHIADGCRLIGADRHAVLLEEAVERFERTWPELEIHYELDDFETWAAAPWFGELDGRYDHGVIGPLCAAFVDAHRDELVPES